MPEVETQIAETAVEAPEPIAPENQSLADHEAQFGPTPMAERDDKGRFTKPPAAAPPERHRPQSQQARPDDVPRISELTKKWRTAEQERDALRAEVEALKNGQRTAPVPSQTTTNTTTTQATAQPTNGAQAPSQPTAQGFIEPEPKIEDFIGKSDDPYLALSRALGRWDRAKERWEENQKNQASTLEKAAEAEFTKIKSTYDERRAAFTKTHKDFDSVVQAAPAAALTQLMQAAILTDDNGPEIVYALAQHPELHYEMQLLTDGKAVTEQSVASLRRVLNARVANVSTGSFPAQAPVTPAPRPLNPVRTGPIRTSDEPPGDEGSLADHERFYGPKKNR